MKIESGNHNVQIPWPKRGDVLFKSDGRGYFLSSVVPDFSFAALGFKEAADALVETARGGRIDHLIFPIVFCYRQYLELRLKAIAESLAEFSGEDYRRTHDLMKLWQPIQAEYRSGFDIDEDEEETFSVVTDCLAEMNRVDPRSVAFRYPEHGPMANLGTAYQIDLENLRSVMGQLATFLDAMNDHCEGW